MNENQRPKRLTAQKKFELYLETRAPEAPIGEILRRYDRVLVPELNRGQLRNLVRAEFLVDAAGLSKVTGRPFAVHEVVEAIEKELT